MMDSFHCTPTDAVGPTMQEAVILDGRTFQIIRPSEPDRLLDHPSVHEAFQRDEYMPYWCDVWPSARMLAKAVLRQDWPTGVETLEVGCGLGLPGIAGLAKGLRVTFSDYDRTALAFAERNARLNGFDEFQLWPMDWRNPPDRRFPLVLAADVIYEERNVLPVVNLLKKVLSSDGECWLTDQDRTPASAFRQALTDNGFQYTTKLMRAGQPGLRVKGTLYRIQSIK